MKDWLKMTANEHFTLFIYEGDYSLPSLDPECVQSVLYTKFANVPVHTKIINSYKSCSLYSGPDFVHKNLSFNTFNGMLMYLNTISYNLDANLSPKQLSESLALKSLVSSKLRPVVEHVFWIDSRNFEEFTRVWYARALPFPFNIFFNKNRRENAIDLIESLYPDDFSTEAIKEHLTAIASECLSSLSARLGTSTFFFGDSPSTLDAIVYSYIAPLIKLPFPTNTLSTMVCLWPNLVNLIKRIDTMYFPDSQKSPKYIKNADKMKTNDEEVSYVAISILTASAVTLVFGFAVSRGFMISNYF